jgi:hypothetical protein
VEKKRKSEIKHVCSYQDPISSVAQEKEKEAENALFKDSVIITTNFGSSRGLGCRNCGISVTAEKQRPFSGPLMSYEKILSIDNM